MHRQPFLTTDRLDLVLLTTDDAPQLAMWMNSHTVTKYLMRGDTPITPEAEVEWVTNINKSHTDLVLGIWHRADEKLIGVTGLHRINHRDQNAHFGIQIGEPDYWSNGYGTEVLQAMLDWAFRIRNLRVIMLDVLGNNPRGQRCYAKCGFVEIGRCPKLIYKDGQWQDEIMMVARNPAYA